MPATTKEDMFGLVSIVIASYNHDKFIAKALDSVAAQTYAKLELIIVDDCSSDNSVAIIKKWISKPLNKKRFSKIIFEEVKQNAGAHNTLNRGANLASGQYINFLNSDDYFENDRIKLLMQEISIYDAKWGFSGVYVVDELEKRVAASDLPPEIGFVYDGIVHAKENFPALSCGLLERNFVVSTGNILVDRDIFLKLGGFRDLKYIHDWDFMLRISREFEPISLDEPLYAYRLHGANSFKSLANIAAIEGAFVMQEHLGSCLSHTKNTQAPSPQNWPVIFDYWVEKLNLKSIIQENKR